MFIFIKKKRKFFFFSFRVVLFLVQVRPCCEKSAPQIQGGGFDQTYRLVQYHFHWGLHDNEGKSQ